MIFISYLFLTFFDFFYLYIQIKRVMKKKTKTELSVSLSDDVIKILNDEFENRSKFIEYCIIKELEKNPEFKERIEKLIIF